MKTWTWRGEKNLVLQLTHRLLYNNSSLVLFSTACLYPIFAVLGKYAYLDKLRGEVDLAVNVGDDEVGVGRVEGDGEGDRGPEEHHGEDARRRRLHLGHRVSDSLQFNHT